MGGFAVEDAALWGDELVEELDVSDCKAIGERGDGLIDRESGDMLVTGIGFADEFVAVEVEETGEPMFCAVRDYEVVGMGFERVGRGKGEIVEEGGEFVEKIVERIAGEGFTFVGEGGEGKRNQREL